MLSPPSPPRGDPRVSCNCTSEFDRKELLMKSLLRSLLLILLAATNAQQLSAQWVQTNGPGGGTILSLAVNGTDLYAGTDGGGVYHSTNNDSDWIAVNNGLTDFHILSLAASDTNL